MPPAAARTGSPPTRGATRTESDRRGARPGAPGPSGGPWAPSAPSGANARVTGLSGLSAPSGGVPAARTQRRIRRRAAPSDSAGPGPRSDIWSRVLVAVPAAIIAIVFIDLGGLAWALFMIAIGAVCMYELYGLLDRWRPAPLVGFASLAAMVIAARYGTARDVLEIAHGHAAGGVPGRDRRRGQRGAATVSIAGTLLGVYWIGFAFAHAELLRGYPTATGS